MQDKKKIEDIRADVNNTLDRIESQLGEMESIMATLDRLAAVSAHADDIIDDVSREFSRVTSLTGSDLCFLFAATVLQCLRQYVIEKITKRVPHDESDKQAHDTQDRIWETDKNKKEGKKGKKKSTWYRASKEEILYTYGVPYDVVSGSKKYGVGGHANVGVSGNNHRYKTLGHDPLYGWVFGTGNIMTNTLTNYKATSYHVKSGKIVEYANTGKMLHHFVTRSQNSPDILACCLIKEGLHLQSDIFSYAGIPLPGIEKWFGPEKAKLLADYGLDCGLAIKTVGESSTAELINILIAMLHRLTLGNIDAHQKLFEVRTRKILLFSNCIASTSNIIKVAVESGAGIVTEDPAIISDAVQSIDWGGLLVTGHRLLKDISFIREVEKEFMEKRFYERIMDEVGMN